MSQCSYIYTKEGIRLPDHKIIVRVRMGDRDLVLRLVRAGKGRSRIDRWENNPQSYGVTGEINTRDLALWHESGELTLWQAHYTPDEKDHAEPVWLDLDRIMGREGREQAGEGLVRALQSLQTLNPGMKSRDNWIIDAILRYAPYGEENSAHYRDAIDMVLPDEDGVGSGYKVSADDIAEKIRSGAVNFMLHCSDDKLEAMMFHPSVREAVESVIKDVSSEQHSLVERLSLVSKIVEAKSYLRRNGRDMQHLMSIHAFSVTDLARMVEDAPLELFDLMAETAPEDAANCIRDGVINTSEAVLLAASLLQRGHSLDKDTVARIAGLMYNQLPQCAI
jgi:hypothetical protein